MAKLKRTKKLKRDLSQHIVSYEQPCTSFCFGAKVAGNAGVLQLEEVATKWSILRCRVKSKEK